MKPSTSSYLDVRGLRYHVRTWNDPTLPKLFLLHGWMDVSASFQFLVDALSSRRHIVAPDWRGFGLSAWSDAQNYWFPDYLADLDVLLGHFQPHAPIDVLGHSMGGNIACLYAGIRPERVQRLINLEGVGVKVRTPEETPVLYRRWFEELASEEGFRAYADFDELQQRLRQQNPRLTEERAAFLARRWGVEREGKVMLGADPAHKRVNPVPYRLAETMACWRAIEAEVLWIEGELSDAGPRHGLNEADLVERRACFRKLRYAKLPAAGHMLHLDQPEALAILIDDFLTEKP